MNTYTCMCVYLIGLETMVWVVQWWLSYDRKVENLPFVQTRSLCASVVPVGARVGVHYYLESCWFSVSVAFNTGYSDKIDELANKCEGKT